MWKSVMIRSSGFGLRLVTKVVWASVDQERQKRIIEEAFDEGTPPARSREETALCVKSYNVQTVSSQLMLVNEDCTFVFYYLFHSIRQLLLELSFINASNGITQLLHIGY